MDESDFDELDRVLRRSYAKLMADRVDPADLDLLRRCFPGNSEEENLLFAVQNDVDELRGRLTIHSEWEPTIPGDETVIRRFLRIERFESLLENEGLWFSRVDAFSDEFEATLPDPNSELRERVREWSGTEHPHNERMEARRDDRTYVNCWRIGEDESAVFWDAYLGDRVGVAVESSVGRFRRAIDRDVSDGYMDLYREYVQADDTDRSAPTIADVYDELSKVQIGRVEYVDYEGSPIPGSMLSFARYFHKRNAFEDEREFRAVFEDQRAYLPDHGGLDSTELHALVTGQELRAAEPGQYVGIDPDELIDAVLLEPNASDALERLVGLLLDEHGVDATVRRSRLDETPN